MKFPLDWTLTLPPLPLVEVAFIDAIATFPFVLAIAISLPLLVIFPVVILPRVLISTAPVLVIGELVLVSKLAKGEIPPTTPLKKIELLPALRLSA